MVIDYMIYAIVSFFILFFGLITFNLIMIIVGVLGLWHFGRAVLEF